MKTSISFVAGFATGWVVRSTIDSSRGVTVGALAALYGAVDRVKRWVAVEHEHIEDLLAEARAKYESERARRVAHEVAEASVSEARASHRAA